MILKINTSRGWRFIDGITELNNETMTPEIYEKEYKSHGRAYDMIVLFYHTLDEKGLHNNSSEASWSIREIWFKSKNTDAQTCLIDSEAYLMSDEGKTIERIN